MHTSKETGSYSPIVQAVRLELQKLDPTERAVAVKELRRYLKPRKERRPRIQKIEIIVRSNDEPSRVAKLVADELANLSHNLRPSPA